MRSADDQQISSNVHVDKVDAPRSTEKEGTPLICKRASVVLRVLCGLVSLLIFTKKEETTRERITGIASDATPLASSLPCCPCVIPFLGVGGPTARAFSCCVPYHGLHECDATDGAAHAAAARFGGRPCVRRKTTSGQP